MQIPTRCRKRKPVGQGRDDIEYTSPEAERYLRRQRRSHKIDYSAADTLLLLNLAESIDTDDDNSNETQTSITDDMINSMQLELQTLRT